MAFRISKGLRTAMLGTGGFKAAMNGGFMDIYSGSQPSTPEDTETGTKLVSVGTASMNWGTAASGIIDKDGTSSWAGTCSVAGVAGWFRFYGPTKLTGADTAGTGLRFDGAIGSVSGEIIMTPTTLALNAPVIINSLALEIPMNQS
jgi:hypothetical protein